MSNVSAGIGRGQMEVLDKEWSKEETITFFYVKLFQEIEGVTVLANPMKIFILIIGSLQ